MHISEGVLSAPVLAAGAVLSVTGVAIGLKKTGYERLPQVAVLSSVFFIASLIHVPVGPAAAHLVLNGICAVLLGWAAFPAILVGLSLQMLLFQFGGITTLGVNTFNMAFPAIVLAFVCRQGIRSDNAFTRGASEFVVGAGSIMLSGLLVALCLVITGEAFTSAAQTIVAVHVPVMLVEGTLTVFIIEFVRKVRPQMLN
ncbi:MAG TPA: cobalt transporter CbiM [Desulfomonilaceae bacterium]|nr:cobalt transporter CbiM [Desulfomonilaceae bacterium]